VTRKHFHIDLAKTPQELLADVRYLRATLSANLRENGSLEYLPSMEFIQRSFIALGLSGYPRWEGEPKDELEADNLLRAWEEFLTARHARRPGPRRSPKRRRRGQRPLTDRQRDIMEVVARHDGDRGAAAKELGITRQAVAKAVAAGEKKLTSAGALAERPARGRRLKNRPLRTDRRGQITDGAR
jgi:hypothetical protein